MGISIKLQHLATIIEVEVSLVDSLESLKEKIEQAYEIPISQQALLLDNRNISTSTKSLAELGIQDGSTVVVRRIHRFTGAQKGFDISSLMKNPMVKGMMKNPETIKSIQEMFPDLKDEMANNKTLSMMINNGGLEEEIEKMSIDSDYMNAQLRNADVTMAKLENIPGGINMMSGMIKDVEDPFKFMENGPGIASGNQLDRKMTKSLPGTSAKNSLVEYRKQLSELKQIGFEDVKENIEILCRVNGDLQAALDILLQKYHKS